MNFSSIDLTVFIGYILLMMGFGIWIANRDKAKNSADYFLASNALPWWAVGGSLIASNISTEQIMGMNGSGFELGLAIATYEMMAALTLIIVAKFFLPVFLKKGIYTMPQFLEQRFDNRTRTLMSVFWLALFVFVNITSVLYLGGLAIEGLLGISLIWGIAGLVIYSATFSIFGGLKAVVWTDVVQVVILVFGGLIASYMVVTAVSGGGFLEGLGILVEKTPERFNMIFSPTDTFIDTQSGETRSAYGLLPGISVLLGGMWIANIYYWGNNQYIIQRALAAKSLKEAQKGVAFAAFMKIFMPLIVVIPGIAAFILNADIEKADQAFPWVLNNHVATGFKGLVFAALVAAIGSSVSSIVNSVSTIFTLDIYKPHINKNASETKLVSIGRITAGASLLIGALIAPNLGSLGQVFQYIQEYTGFISPGVVAVFLFGMFWRRTTANAAFITILVSIPISIFFKLFFPELPFLDRMAFSFLMCCLLLMGLSMAAKTSQVNTISDRAFRMGLIVVMGIMSVSTGLKILLEETEIGSWVGFLMIAMGAVLSFLLFSERKADDNKAIDIDRSLFQTDASFNISAISIAVLLALFYAVFW